MGSRYQGLYGWGGDGKLQAPRITLSWKCLSSAQALPPQLVSPLGAGTLGSPAGRCRSGACDMIWGMGGHQAGCSTLPVPSLCSQGATGCQSREPWGETSLQVVPRPWSGGGSVCHQCVTVPDHCQVPGCIWDLTQPWEPEGCGWAQGADSSPGAQGGTHWRSLSS